MKIIVPVRQWQWSREEEIAYAKENDVPIPADLEESIFYRPKLVGTCMWCVLEDPWATPPSRCL